MYYFLFGLFLGEICSIYSLRKIWELKYLRARGQKGLCEVSLVVRGFDYVTFMLGGAHLE